MTALATSATDADMQTQAGTDQYLTFMLAGEEYGVDILRVQEIKGWDSATPIPNSPPYMLGVINLRGTVVPIVNLRTRFGLQTIDFGPTTVVIVLRISGADHDRTMGIVVDAVSDVYNVPAESVGPTPDLGGAMTSRCVKGLAKVQDKMVILLDVDNLITLEDIDDAEVTTH